jgi:hypothetical protein
MIGTRIMFRFAFVLRTTHDSLLVGGNAKQGGPQAGAFSGAGVAYAFSYNTRLS